MERSAENASAKGKCNKQAITRACQRVTAISLIWHVKPAEWGEKRKRNAASREHQSMSFRRPRSPTLAHPFRTCLLVLESTLKHSRSPTASLGVIWTHLDSKAEQKLLADTSGPRGPKCSCHPADKNPPSPPAAAEARGPGPALNTRCIEKVDALKTWVQWLPLCYKKTPHTMHKHSWDSHDKDVLLSIKSSCPLIGLLLAPPRVCSRYFACGRRGISEFFPTNQLLLIRYTVWINGLVIWTHKHKIYSLAISLVLFLPLYNHLPWSFEPRVTRAPFRFPPSSET